MGSYVDYDRLLEDDDDEDNKLVEDLDEQINETTALDAQMHRRHERVLNIGQEFPQLVHLAQADSDILDQQEHEIFALIGVNHQLVEEMMSLKHRIYLLRKDIELTTHTACGEQRFNILHQLEYRKLHNMMLDYMKFVQIQVRFYRKAGHRVPRKMLSEFVANRALFERIKNHLKSVYAEARAIFDTQRRNRNLNED